MKNKPKRQKKSKKIIYKTLDDVHCPICNGVINSKWFSFRSGNVVEFIAECWSGDISLEIQPPRHLFYFQIEVPDCLLLPAKGSKVFERES